MSKMLGSGVVLPGSKRMSIGFFEIIDYGTCGFETYEVGVLVVTRLRAMLGFNEG